ncbi:MAG: protease HtpX [Candidatus Omnitrophica bacterium CG11_big_fil_rev_8_21_14_0_20_64_10]|nr:MAG: protease HtpX [Candidatus Omnitrophica bacterium CG11_big_fil_rev_8_21_14_0_20_64_10]
MNALKTGFLLALLTLLFIWIGGMIGGQQGMVMAFVFALLMNGGAYWFSDKIVLKMYRARPATEAEAPVLVRTVQRLAEQSGMPMPAVYIIPGETPNAFATGRSPKHAAVAATEGILRLLSPEELEGVLAHELAHVRNRDVLVSSIAAAIAGAIYMLANWARWAMIFGGGRGRNQAGAALHLILLLVISIIAPLAAMLVQMAISRSREYGADASGAELCGKPLALAAALRKIHAGAQQRPMEANPATAHLFIVNPLTGGGLMSLFSTHPPLAKRIEILERMAAS